MNSSSTPPPSQSQPNLKFLVAESIDQLSILGTLVVLWLLKHSIEWVYQQIDRNSDQAPHQSVAVLDICSQLLVHTNSDRVVVAFFHNGGKFTNGWHHKKMTVTFEVAQPGISRISNQVRNVPLTNLLVDLQRFRENTNQFTILVTNQVELPCRAYLESTGTRIQVNQLITWDKQELGILSIQYVKTNPISPEEINDILEKEQVKGLASQLRLIIANKKSRIFSKIWQNFKN